MKKIKSSLTLIILVVLLVSINGFIGMLTGKGIVTSAESTNQDMKESVIFPHDQVVEMNIDMDESVYEDMITNAMNEEYVMADITYNGYAFSSVAIRPKGNSSLKQVANSGNDRFSFKIDFNAYIDDQDFFGITKINLNNLFEDPSLMAEYISYEMLDSLDAVGPDTTYVALSINGEYYGLYLAVEEVNKPFLEENFGNKDGQLYKPEMGAGADLSYISDDPSDYTGIILDDEYMTTGNEFVQFVKTIDQIIEEGGETAAYRLSDVMNVDSFLKYLALSSTVIHMDAYQAGMFHNYYLYYNTDTGLYEWITWDLNMSFNGFPMAGLTDEEACQFFIDEPVIGNMDQYPLIEAVFTNESYVETYHEYIERLATQYLDEDNLEKRVTAVYDLIKDYAEADTNPFYDMATVQKSIFDSGANENMSILEFASFRVDNILAQLAGDLPSTNNGMGNQGSGGDMGPRGGMRPDGGQEPDGGVRPDRDMMPGGGMKPDGDKRLVGDIRSNEEIKPEGAVSTNHVDTNNLGLIGGLIIIISGFGIYLKFRKF